LRGLIGGLILRPVARVIVTTQRIKRLIKKRHIKGKRDKKQKSKGQHGREPENKIPHRICNRSSNASSSDKMTADCLRFGQKYSNKNATEGCSSVVFFVSTCQKA
jgi:hypothetical protein